MHVTDTNSSHSKGLKLFFNLNLQVCVPGSTFEMQGSLNCQELFSEAKKIEFITRDLRARKFIKGVKSQGAISLHLTLKLANTCK